MSSQSTYAPDPLKLRRKRNVKNIVDTPLSTVLDQENANLDQVDREDLRIVERCLTDVEEGRIAGFEFQSEHETVIEGYFKKYEGAWYPAYEGAVRITRNYPRRRLLVQK